MKNATRIYVHWVYEVAAEGAARISECALYVSMNNIMCNWYIATHLIDYRFILKKEF